MERLSHGCHKYGTFIFAPLRVSVDIVDWGSGGEALVKIEDLKCHTSVIRIVMNGGKWRIRTAKRRQI
jgi:hypothetical protein